VGWRLLPVPLKTGTAKFVWEISKSNVLSSIQTELASHIAGPLAMGCSGAKTAAQPGRQWAAFLNPT
jgi:hypothetical protein